MELTVGYKQTEVGLIPDDWVVKSLQELGRWKGGMTPSMQNPAFWTGGIIPWVSSGDVKSVQLLTTNKQITPIAVKQGTTTMLPANSILLVMRSGILRKYLPVAINAVPMAINQDIKSLVPHQEFHSTFLLYVLIDSGPRILAECMKAGTTVESVDFRWLKAFCICIPKSAVEQRAIATVLSDVDDLLSSIDQLIAKKRNLKQAAMQQLLTGQTRLPGFSGEWVVKTLGQLADIRSGGTPSTGQSSFWNGNVPWCTPTDITALNGHKYLGETERMISQLGLKASSAEMIPAYSVVMTSRATIGECAINSVPVSTNQGFKNFVPLETTDVNFLYYLLITQKQGFISLCSGSTFLEIGKTQLLAYQVKLPATKVEQTMIAKVLSEMDAELITLKAQRNKTAQIKQGMMQELLTGRTRLV
jgi:type I restriction enzyme S subunit